MKAKDGIKMIVIWQCLIRFVKSLIWFVNVCFGSVIGLLLNVTFDDVAGMVDIPVLKR